MRFLIERGKVEEMKKGDKMGILDGVRRNGWVVGKEGVDLDRRVGEMCEMVGDVCVRGEVMGVDGEGMIGEGKEVGEMGGKIRVKVGMSPGGVEGVGGV